MEMMPSQSPEKPTVSEILERGATGDSALHNNHQNTTEENIFWKNVAIEASINDTRPLLPIPL